MRVLVTGATGFIGGHVCDRLLARGHAVRALVRPTSTVDGLPAAVELARGQLDDAGAALDGIEGLVHLAGVSGAMMRRGAAHDSEVWRVNVDGTRRLFDAARVAGVRRGVQVTSAWTVLRPELAARSVYLASRIASEQAAIAAGFEVCCVCPTFVVGAGDRGPNLPGALVRAVARGRMPVIPAGGMTWIAVEDAAASIVAALERGTPRTSYVIGAEFASHRDLLGRVARLAGRRAPTIVAPRALLAAAGRTVDLAVGLVGRELPLPLGLGVELLSIDRAIDCSLAHRALGAPEVPLDRALADAIAWFRGVVPPGGVEPPSQPSEGRAASVRGGVAKR